MYQRNKGFLSKFIFLFYCTLQIVFCFNYVKGFGTPLIALREAENCQGCHNPGRGQLPVLERRCTLDCQGCHIDPNGGGARNEWGYYYSHDQMAMINFLTPVDPLQNTDILSFHYDTKILQYKYADKTINQMPMYEELTIRARPFYSYTHLNLIYTWLHLGRHGDDLYRLGSEGNNRNREKYSIMFDALPFNTYIRAYRGTPTYGIKRTNHSQWIRERIGLGQYAVTDAYEIGGTPNVPFFRASLLKGDPYVKGAYKQKGLSYHGGVRGVTLGWHVNGSGWKTKSDYHKIDMRAFGAGLNAYGLILYGEKNWRKISSIKDLPAGTGKKIYPSSEIAEYTVSLAPIKGIMPGVLVEQMNSSGISSKRISYFVDIHPIPFLQLELWRREETGSRNLKDIIGIVHGFVDF